MGKGILFIVLAASLAGLLVLKNTQDLSFEGQNATTSYERDVVTREIARSALNLAVAEAQRDFANAASNLDFTDKPYQGGAFTIDATQLTPVSLKLDVTSSYSGATYGIDATLVMASPLDAALIVEAPDASPQINGTSFLISGIDTAPPSSTSSSPGLNRNGIRTNLTSVRNAFRSAVGPGRYQNVQGINGDGDIVSGPFEANLQEIYAEAKLNPDRVLAGGNVSGTYGTTNTPEIVVVNGDANIPGFIQGVGLLIVDGSLTINGDLNWEGLVMVRDTDDLDVRNNGTATIYGGMVLLQGTSAFTMPVTGRLNIRYLYSSAGFQSSVHIHPYGMAAEQVFAKGSNRNGDQMDVWDQVYERGTQMNFFIRTWPAWGVGAGTTYDHYARGHESPVSGHPYADVEQVGDYLWRIGFEDLDEAVGYAADWDYDDQVIEVEVLPNEQGEPVEEAFTPWWSYAGGEEGEEDGEGEDGGYEVAQYVTGNMLHFRLNGDTNIHYSSEAIARLAGRLDSVREAVRIVVVEQWEEQHGE